MSCLVFEMDSDDDGKVWREELDALCDQIESQCAQIEDTCDLMYGRSAHVFQRDEPCGICALCEHVDVAHCVCNPGFTGTLCHESSVTFFRPEDGETCEHTAVHIVYEPPDDFAQAITFQLLGPLVEVNGSNITFTHNETNTSLVAVLGDFHAREGYHNETHRYTNVLVSHTFQQDVGSDVYDRWLCNVDPGVYLFEVSDFHPYLVRPHIEYQIVLQFLTHLCWYDRKNASATVRSTQTGQNMRWVSTPFRFITQAERQKLSSKETVASA